MLALSQQRKKNILYISFLGILEPVAFSQVFTYIMELSKEDDLHFTLLTFEKKSFLERNNYLSYEEIKNSLTRNNVDWRILRHHKGVGKIYDFFRGFIYAFILVLKKRIDVIHARSSEPVILSFFISKIIKVKVIYDRRGMMAEDYSDDATTNFKLKKNGLLYRLIDRFEKNIMHSSDAIVVLTDRISNYILKDKYFKERKNIFVVPCCVDLNRFNKHIKNNSSLLSDLKLNDKFIFNYTGSLCNLHSLSEMLDFFKIAKKIIINAHFMFLTLVDRHLIESYLKLKGLCNMDVTIVEAPPLKVNAYLSACDASMMFFKPTFIRWAASPTKLAECLASGLPVIINKGIGDTEELIEKNRIGVVMDTFSETAYIKALEKLLKLYSEPDLRLRCRRVAESNFSLQLGIEKYRKIYDCLLA